MFPFSSSWIIRLALTCQEILLFSFLQALQGLNIPFLRIVALLLLLIAYAEDNDVPSFVVILGSSINPSLKSAESLILEAVIILPLLSSIRIFPTASIIFLDGSKATSSASSLYPSLIRRTEPFAKTFPSLLIYSILSASKIFS